MYLSLSLSIYIYIYADLYVCESLCFWPGGVANALRHRLCTCVRARAFVQNTTTTTNNNNNNNNHDNNINNTKLSLQ